MTLDDCLTVEEKYKKHVDLIILEKAKKKLDAYLNEKINKKSFDIDKKIISLSFKYAGNQLIPSNSGIIKRQVLKFKYYWGLLLLSGGCIDEDLVKLHDITQGLVYHLFDYLWNEKGFPKRYTVF